MSRSALHATVSDGFLPATAGSYGLAPRGFRLPATTRLGRVVLQISDLERSVAFYQSVLGLKPLRTDDSRAVLGSPTGEPLVELRQRPGARPQPLRRTGLFHFALVLPDRASLGNFIRHVELRGVRIGASDHQVSEAIYLEDPDGLGIEVYRDRPREDWQRLGRELRLTSDRLDFSGLQAAASDEPWDGVPPGTRMGHVHLQVGDLDQAAEFFSEALGFDRITWQYPGALFLGAGGYHHHLGTNTWRSSHAGPAQEDEAQLLEWTIQLPDVETLEAAAASLESAGHSVTRTDAVQTAIVVADPWQTKVRLQVAVPSS